MSISVKWKKIFQKEKRHSSAFWKAFQISRKYFSCHRHFKTISRVHHDYMTPESCSAVSIKSTKSRQIFMYHRYAVPQISKKCTLINSTATVSPIFLIRYLRWLERNPRSIIDWALNKIIIYVRMMQIIYLAWACILELLRNCIIFELVTLHSEGIFTWVHDTYSSKVIISTKFSNTCKQLSITLGNLISLNILPIKLCPPHLNRK